jgi:predicted DNA-binding transcriptional regulator AlpA
MARPILTLPEIAERTRLPEATIRWYRFQQLHGANVGPRMFKLGARVVGFEDDVNGWISAQAAAELGGDAA